MFRLIIPAPLLLPVLLALPLIGCSFGAPPQAASASQSADLSACTQAANQINEARHYSYISRTDQMATPLSGLPQQRYITNRLAEIHDRDERIKNCMENGNQANSDQDAGLPEPKIIGPAQ
jgi:hypothetical protein